MAKPKYLLACDGKHLYVKSKYSGISQLVQLIDGIRQYQFKGDKNYYLLVADAANWHEKELRESHGQSGSKEVLTKMRDLLQRFEEGKLVDKDGKPLKEEPS